MQVGFWREAARDAGYDRMVIHDRDEGDASEVGNFLSVHRSGQAWSRWGFARAGTRIRSWCCLSGADVGEFASLNEALSTVLAGVSEAPLCQPRVEAPSNLVHLSFNKRVESAA